MTKKKKTVKVELSDPVKVQGEMTLTYHLHDQNKTVVELEKDADLVCLKYLEAITEVKEARATLSLKEKALELAANAFTEAKCQHLAKKHGIERMPKESVSVWTSKMSYAK